MSHHSAGATAPSTDMGECLIEMTWNWNTINACFLSKSWHVKNQAMFATSCIGVVLLVVSLELMRRIGKEFDAHLTRQFQRQVRAAQALEASNANFCGIPEDGPRYANFRATGLQQLCRAIIHGITLGLAYIIMLLVMHYNGYIFISVVLGAILGKFLCDWMVVRIPYVAVADNEERKTSIEAAGPTGCCA